jgi:hypothetical protein
MKNILIGTVRSKPENITKNQGHEYGAGRGEKVMKHKNVKREKERLRREIERMY